MRALTISFHLGDTVSTIDLNKESLEPAQLAHIERLANAIVAEARPVTLRTVSAEDADLMLQAGTLRKLPTRSGDIRIVVIAGETAAGAISGAGAEPGTRTIHGRGAPNHDLDVNACGGTHVASTSQIGAVLLRGTERIRQSTRVSFLCGNRAIAAARADDALLTQLSRELSVARADLPAALTRLKSETRAAAKERQTLREELANYHAARLLVEDPPQNDLRIVRRIFPDRDADYIKLLASRVTSAAPHTVAVFASTQQQAESPRPLCRLQPGAGPQCRRTAALRPRRLWRPRRRISHARAGPGAAQTSSPAVLDALEASCAPEPAPAV